jgi:hypothetical protein
MVFPRGEGDFTEYDRVNDFDLADLLLNQRRRNRMSDVAIEM